MMQNKHKFRIWDSQKKTMHYNDFVITSTGYVAKVETHMEALGKFIIDQTNLELDKKMIVMQCSGRFDDKKQLIYEGDIVNGHCGVYWGKMLVVRDEEKAAFYFKKKKGELLPFIDELFVEILGNKYENPELNPENSEDPDEYI